MEQIFDAVIVGAVQAGSPRLPAGLADCIDTHESFRRQLTKLRELRIVP
jgi:hypothetical protein